MKIVALGVLVVVLSISIMSCSTTSELHSESEKAMAISESIRDNFTKKSYKFSAIESANLRNLLCGLDIKPFSNKGTFVGMPRYTINLDCGKYIVASDGRVYGAKETCAIREEIESFIESIDWEN